MADEIVHQLGHRRLDHHAQAGFLAEFARHRLFWRFARIDAAARQVVFEIAIADPGAGDQAVAPQDAVCAGARLVIKALRASYRTA